LEYGLRWNALESSIEQEEPVENGLAEGHIGLLKPVLALAVELVFNVAV
jgi:hypothetical protein